MLGQDARDAVRKGEHPLRPEPERPPAADPRELGDDLLEAALGRQRGRHAEGQRDQAAHGLGHRHRVGPGLAHRDEDLEGLAVAVLVDDDVGRAERRLDAVRPAREAPRAGA